MAVGCSRGNHRAESGSVMFMQSVWWQLTSRWTAATAGRVAAVAVTDYLKNIADIKGHADPSSFCSCSLLPLAARCCCSCSVAVPNRSDYKEGERVKLAGLIHAAASKQNSQRFYPKMTVLDLQVSGLETGAFTSPGFPCYAVCTAY